VIDAEIRVFEDIRKSSTTRKHMRYMAAERYSTPCCHRAQLNRLRFAGLGVFGRIEKAA
jgi:hypothetical protein